jgi:hypothetical protein
LGGGKMEDEKHSSMVSRTKWEYNFFFKTMPIIGNFFVTIWEMKK